MEQGASGIKYYKQSELSETEISAAIFPKDFFETILDDNYSRLEKLGIATIKKTLSESAVKIDSSETVLILSSTKGNVELLAERTTANTKHHLELWQSANKIANYFAMKTMPRVVSTACVSGASALVLGQRLIEMGMYSNAVVLGVDVLSRFIVSGFQSFKALSSQRCKPFDINRNGLNLGEGAGVVILTNNKTEQGIEIAGGATSNDANHISGPSRTGEGLLSAINKSLSGDTKIDFISAHGTATQYNDDMESKAIFRADLDTVPVNSLKGYFGHTLGAAGVIESVVTLESMKRGVILSTIGLTDLGTAEKINVLNKKKHTKINSALKLTSGFGGTNAVVFFRRYDK